MWFSPALQGGLQAAAVPLRDQLRCASVKRLPWRTWRSSVVPAMMNHTTSVWTQQASASSTAPPKRGSDMFRAPPNVGSGRSAGPEANPYKSWEHMNHMWLIMMCMGCLSAGLLAGRYVEVDESKIKPKFVKEEVIEAAEKHFEFRPDLAATSIRVAYVLAARRAGFAADTIDESCAVVAGLGDIAGVINYLTTTFGASTEDAAALCAVAGVKYLRGPWKEVLEAWRWGRNDADVAPSRNVPTDASKETFTPATILHGLGDLSDEECVALMGCHGVGEFHEEVSGVEDAVTRMGRRYTLDNSYFKFLLDHEKSLKRLELQRTETNRCVPQLPRMMWTMSAGGDEGGMKRKPRRCVLSEVEVEALLRRPAWRVIVERFAKDPEAWKQAFASGFTKMLDSHFRRLRPYSDPRAS